MSTRRLNPNAIKLRRTYTARELAIAYGLHKNTIRAWQRDGLTPLDGKRPVLFMGEDVRTFLASRNVGRKRPCPAGTLYCFRCREARPPALGMVDYLATTETSGNLRALCGVCETIMHRRVSKSAIADVLPGIAVHVTEDHARLIGRHSPSLNCVLEGRTTT